MNFINFADEKMKQMNMTKQEYFNTLLKRDVIRYIVLQKPRYDDTEVARKLISIVNVDLLYDRMVAHIPSVLDKYLSVDKIKDAEGNIVKTLPEWLDISLAQKVVKEFSSLIAGECSMDTTVSEIITRIEKLTWVQGVDDMVHNLRRFIKDLRNTSAHYAKVYRNEAALEEIKEKYDDARRVTLREHVLKDNDKDVTAFLEALTIYSRDLCVVEISRRLSRLYSDIASSEEINGIIERFTRIHAESQAEYDTFGKIGAHEGWDAEYRIAFPMDFFERNIEDIDASKAFLMVFLQALSRHEAELKELGLLNKNGELIFFTASATDSAACILSWCEKII